MTDSEGKAKITRVPPGNYQLKISYLGFATEIDSIQVEPGKTTVRRFVLEPVEAKPYPGQMRRGVPVGDVIPFLSSSPRVQTFRLVQPRIPQDTTVVGPTLSANQIRKLEWLLLEKDGKFIGGNWTVAARRCISRPTLAFRFLTSQGEGVAEVDLGCMRYTMRVGEFQDGGNLKLESRSRFVGFALRLFPNDPVLPNLKDYGKRVDSP